mmetsp:Transcript_60131/g.178296  ORF Transcript_60131/g.178296 Transcript_60131/m.178296 type:complete len:373 (+) Transcript_60131:180-1298(+)
MASLLWLRTEVRILLPREVDHACVKKVIPPVSDMGMVFFHTVAVHPALDEGVGVTSGHGGHVQEVDGCRRRVDAVCGATLMCLLGSSRLVVVVAVRLGVGTFGILSLGSRGLLPRGDEILERLLGGASPCAPRSAAVSTSPFALVHGVVHAIVVLSQHRPVRVGRSPAVGGRRRTDKNGIVGPSHISYDLKETIQIGSHVRGCQFPLLLMSLPLGREESAESPVIVRSLGGARRARTRDQKRPYGTGRVHGHPRCAVRAFPPARRSVRRSVLRRTVGDLIHRLRRDAIVPCERQLERTSLSGTVNVLGPNTLLILGDGVGIDVAQSEHVVHGPDHGGLDLVADEHDTAESEGLRDVAQTVGADEIHGALGVG